MMIAVIYAFMLAWFWNSGFSHTTQLWGYLPTSDTAAYYLESYGLLAGDKISGTAVPRPLFTILLSSLFSLFDLSPRNVLIFLVYLNLLGSYLAASEIRKTHGALAGSLYILAGLLFYRVLMGTFMTEQIGFLLANIAFAFFWHGIHHRQASVILIGLFTLSIGLNFRAGAMFTLFTIPLWVGLTFTKKKFSVKWAGIALIVALMGFVINSFGYKLFLPKDVPMFSNYGSVLYGVAVGNQGWTQISVDHPGIQPSESLSVAFQQILKDPFLFIKGVLKVYIEYVNPDTRACNAFCFLRLYSLPKNLLLMLLSFAGLAVTFFTRKEMLSSFLLFAFLGIFLSIPFAPTRDVGYRSYTITDPYLVGLVIVSIYWIGTQAKRLLKRVMNQNTVENNSSESIFPLTYILLFVPLSLAVIFPVLSIPQQPVVYNEPSSLCKSDETLVGFWTNRDAWIHVVSEGSIPQDVLIPFIASGKMETLLQDSAYHKSRFSDVLPFVKSGVSISWIPRNYYFNKIDAKGALAVVNTKDLPEQSGFLTFCAFLIPSDGRTTPAIRVATAANLDQALPAASISIPGPQTANMFLGIMKFAIALIVVEFVFINLNFARMRQWFNVLKALIERFFSYEMEK
jgi:hypothetical protein